MSSYQDIHQGKRFRCLRGIGSQLANKSISHWFIAGGLIVLALLAENQIDERRLWIELRYRVYQNFNQFITFHPPHPKRTKLVLIDDEDYWKGPLARRYPLKRDYLAALINKLDAADAEIIALDLDLSSASPNDGLEEFPDYRIETQQLLETIKTVSHNRTIVLGRAIEYADADNGIYRPIKAIYDNYDFEGGNVEQGYITLPYDLRRVALEVKMEEGRPLASFATAIVRSLDEKSLEVEQSKGNDSLPYGTFLNCEDFPVKSASYILETDPKILKKEFGFKTVIVGGAWQKYGFKRGPKNDGHISPLGNIYGVFIHANYVEALLDSRTYKPMGKWLVIGVEAFVSAVLAVTLALQIGILRKIILSIILCIMPIFISYFSWQNLGLFFDFFIPAIFLLAHIMVDELRLKKHSSGTL